MTYSTDVKINNEEKRRLQQMLLYEEQMYEADYKVIAGVDEAGRGPLAGPVVAAACILPRGLLIPNLNDSKLLTSKIREKLYHRLTSDPSISYAVGIVDSQEIDRINIYQASIQAMLEAVEKLAKRPDCLLVDGIRLPHSSIYCHQIIKGDQLSLSIAAASIIAKRTRDEMLRMYHQQWPQYGFNQHKGYGTELHREALEQYGPCPIHRFSFHPLNLIPNFKFKVNDLPDF